MGAWRYKNEKRDVYKRQEQEIDRVFDVGVYAAAVDDRAHNRGEIVVGQDHGGRVLGNLGTRDARCV